MFRDALCPHIGQSEAQPTAQTANRSGAQNSHLLICKEPPELLLVDPFERDLVALRANRERELIDDVAPEDVLPQIVSTIYDNRN